MRTKCPHCKACFNIKPEYVGKRTKCKNCGEDYLIAAAADLNPVTATPSPAELPIAQIAVEKPKNWAATEEQGERPAPYMVQTAAENAKKSASDNELLLNAISSFSHPAVQPGGFEKAACLLAPSLTEPHQAYTEAGGGYEGTQFPTGSAAYSVSQPKLSSAVYDYPDLSLRSMADSGSIVVPGQGQPSSIGEISASERPALKPVVYRRATSEENQAVIAARQLGKFIIRQLGRVPRSIWITAGLMLILGATVGFRVSSRSSEAAIDHLEARLVEIQQRLSTQNNNKINALTAERLRLQNDLRQMDSYNRDYPEGSIIRVLALAASEEIKIADTLLLQQIVAIETGARVTTMVKQTKPDPELATTLEAEMVKIQEDIARQQQEIENLDDTPKRLAATGIAAQMLSQAIVNRNLLIAKYGFGSPVIQQYQYPSEPGRAQGTQLTFASKSAADALDGGEVPPIELEQLKNENKLLRAENDMLLNSDSTIYASAVGDLGAGQLGSAEGKFKRLLQIFPASPLAAKAEEGLAEVKTRLVEREAAKNTPVEIVNIGVKHDGGYFRNQSYVRVSFKNISQLMIKRVEFQILTFDEHGYPIASKRLGITDENSFSGTMTENIPPSREGYGVWELSEKVRRVKVRLKAVEFYDIVPWRDEDIGRWLDIEGGRFHINGKAG